MDRFPFTLSLYAIVSRECASKYVTRALESFKVLKPDEIVLCSAMGKHTEEGLPILEEVAKKFGAKVVVYKNKDDASHWEHLDNFADARNTALEACTQEFCMWFDADDVLPEGAEKAFFAIGEKVTDHDCIFAGYSVPLAGLCPVRERITRNKKFKWKYPVHEQLKPTSTEGAKALGTHAGLITHAPIDHKGSSVTRNHRILDEAIRENYLFRFYKAEEYFLSGKYDEAMQHAKTALADHTLDPILRVQCHTIVGRSLADPVAKREELFRAYALMPHRIEALFYIAEDYYTRKHYTEALALARSACSIPIPNIAYWTTKEAIYKWEAPDLYERCARVLGDEALVKFLQEDKVKNFGEVDITLCHATARPTGFQGARWAWLAMAKQPNKIQHILGVDVDADEYGGNEKIITPNGKCVGAWNSCAQQAKGKYIVQVSDDFVPPLGWDEEIRKRLPDPTKPAVLAVSDGYRKDDLLCIAICTKPTLDYLGGNLFAPEYAECSGIFSDNEFTARTKDIQVNGRDLVFKHNNPFFTNGQQDEVFKKHNAISNYDLGKKIFEQRNPCVS
jgi:glycosyltransferase involved in cell wall biosynthesis